MDTALWTPTSSRIADSRISAFSRYAEKVAGTPFATYADLYAWSVASPHTFWPAVWDYCGIAGERGERVLLDSDRMPGARWFPDARLNFAENLLRNDGPENALVFWGEDKVKRSLSRDELRRQALRLAAGFRGMGVRPGDRVAAYMPNMPETIVTMLATATLGATFTSASPDFGVQGVLDRFGQTQPKVLVACDGYWYNGKAVDVLGKLGPIVDGLPSVQHVA